MRTSLIAVLFCCLLAIPFAVRAEDLTITTYYPSPNGVYKTLTLHAHGETHADCSPDGKMYFEDGSGGVRPKGFYVCKDTVWKSVPLGGGSFGGMYENGELKEDRTCGTYGSNGATNDTTGLIQCCETRNPLTGGCSCPSGFYATCLDKGDERSSSDFTVAPIGPRERADEICYCLPNP